MPQAPQGAAETLEASEPDLAGLPTVDVQGEKPAQADLPDAPTQLTRFGHYVLLHELGRGGMGVVYAAYDEKLDRKVAIKVLRAQGDPSAQRRLVREAQGLARLSHPNVVQIYEIDDIDGQGFLAMEFIDGSTLRSWRVEQPRTFAEILAAALAAGRGLAAAHAKSDFKPKYRRPSQTAPQPTDRPHSHELGRFERVDVDRLAPRYPALPQVLAKGWQGSQAALMLRRH
jgi:hypothetical protein